MMAAVSIFIIASAFYEPKCDHVFTEVEQAEVKIDVMRFDLSIGKVGKQEGKDLICMKCFHRQKQIVDYGGVIPTNSIDTNSGLLGISARSIQWPFVLAGPFVFDSVTMKH
jgi:hypothetical protein